MTIVQSKYTLNNEKRISGNEKACFKIKCVLDAMKKSASNDLRNPHSKKWSEICVVYNEKCALYNKKKCTKYRSCNEKRTTYDEIAFHVVKKSY